MPDLLLTDIAMPDENGLALAERLTQQFPALEVLLMTGYAPARLQDVRWPHITKPFTPTELMPNARRAGSSAQPVTQPSRTSRSPGLGTIHQPTLNAVS